MKRTPVNKTPIDPGRIRQLPAGGFSWIDRRFVREGFLADLPGEASLLYLFLVAVSDAKGLSFYSDPTVTRLLKLNHEELTQARFWLENADLVLYRYPLYQVLSLPPQRSSLAGASTSTCATSKSTATATRATTSEQTQLTASTAPTPSSSSRYGGDKMSLTEFLARTAHKRDHKRGSWRKS